MPDLKRVWTILILVALALSFSIPVLADDTIHSYSQGDMNVILSVFENSENLLGLEWKESQDGLSTVREATKINEDNSKTIYIVREGGQGKTYDITNIKSDGSFNSGKSLWVDETTNLVEIFNRPNSKETYYESFYKDTGVMDYVIGNEIVEKDDKRTLITFERDFYDNGIVKKNDYEEKSDDSFNQLKTEYNTNGDLIEIDSRDEVPGFATIMHGLFDDEGDNFHNYVKTQDDEGNVVELQNKYKDNLLTEQIGKKIQDGIETNTFTEFFDNGNVAHEIKNTKDGNSITEEEINQDKFGKLLTRTKVTNENGNKKKVDEIFKYSDKGISEAVISFIDIQGDKELLVSQESLRDSDNDGLVDKNTIIDNKFDDKNNLAKTTVVKKVIDYISDEESTQLIPEEKTAEVSEAYHNEETVDLFTYFLDTGDEDGTGEGEIIHQEYLAYNNIPVPGAAGTILFWDDGLSDAGDYRLSDYVDENKNPSFLGYVSDSELRKIIEESNNWPIPELEKDSELGLDVNSPYRTEEFSVYVTKDYLYPTDEEEKEPLVPFSGIGSAITQGTPLEVPYKSPFGVKFDSPTRTDPFSIYVEDPEVIAPTPSYVGEIEDTSQDPLTFNHELDLQSQEGFDLGFSIYVEDDYLSQPTGIQYTGIGMLMTNNYGTGENIANFDGNEGTTQVSDSTSTIGDDAIIEEASGEVTIVTETADEVVVKEPSEEASGEVTIVTETAEETGDVEIAQDEVEVGTLNPTTSAQSGLLPGLGSTTTANERSSSNAFFNRIPESMRTRFGLFLLIFVIAAYASHITIFKKAKKNNYAIVFGFAVALIASFSNNPVVGMLGGVVGNFWYLLAAALLLAALIYFASKHKGSEDSSSSGSSPEGKSGSSGGSSPGETRAERKARERKEKLDDIITRNDEDRSKRETETEKEVHRLNALLDEALNNVQNAEIPELSKVMEVVDAFLLAKQNGFKPTKKDVKQLLKKINVFIKKMNLEKKDLEELTKVADKLNHTEFDNNYIFPRGTALDQPIMPTLDLIKSYLMRIVGLEFVLVSRMTSPPPLPFREYIKNVQKWLLQYKVILIEKDAIIRNLNLIFQHKKDFTDLTNSSDFEKIKKELWVIKKLLNDNIGHYLGLRKALELLAQLKTQVDQDKSMVLAYVIQNGLINDEPNNAPEEPPRNSRSPGLSDGQPEDEIPPGGFKGDAEPTDYEELDDEVIKDDERRNEEVEKEIITELEKDKKEVEEEIKEVEEEIKEVKKKKSGRPKGSKNKKRRTPKKTKEEKEQQEYKIFVTFIDMDNAYYNIVSDNIKNKEILDKNIVKYYLQDVAGFQKVSVNNVKEAENIFNIHDNIDILKSWQNNNVKLAEHYLAKNKNEKKIAEIENETSTKLLNAPSEEFIAEEKIVKENEELISKLEQIKSKLEENSSHYVDIIRYIKRIARNKRTLTKNTYKSLKYFEKHKKYEPRQRTFYLGTKETIFTTTGRKGKILHLNMKKGRKALGIR